MDNVTCMLSCLENVFTCIVSNIEIKDRNIRKIVKNKQATFTHENPWIYLVKKSTG